MTTWGVHGTLAAVGVAALVASFGGTAIYAATNSDGHVMGMHGPPGPPGPGGPGGFGGGPGGFGPPHDRAPTSGSTADDLAAALHGEFVVPDGKGGYTTVLAQTGTVTAIAANSITARSSDGFVQPYAVKSAAVTAQFAIDDEVTIRASRGTAGNDPTITTIKSSTLAHTGA